MKRDRKSLTTPNSYEIAHSVFEARRKGIDFGGMPLEELCSYIAEDMNIKYYSVNVVRAALGRMYWQEQYR